MPLIGVWAGMVTFDLFVLAMVFANAVNKPYRQNMEVVHSLYRDGIKYFAALLCMRVVNLLLTIFSTPGEVLVIIFFLWAMVSIILSRFLLTVKAMEREATLRGASATPTTTILWRSHSGHWSRKSDLIELKVAP